jgi:hypothetical protein
LHQYWLTGSGIGNFELAYAQYFLATPHAALYWYRPAHSVLIGSAVEYGIFGFALLIALWVTHFTQLRLLAKSCDESDFAAALQAGLIGLFVAGISIDLMLTKYTWLAFSIIALTSSASNAARMSEIEPSLRTS